MSKPLRSYPNNIHASHPYIIDTQATLMAESSRVFNRQGPHVLRSCPHLHPKKTAWSPHLADICLDLSSSLRPTSATTSSCHHELAEQSRKYWSKEDLSSPRPLMHLYLSYRPLHLYCSTDHHPRLRPHRTAARRRPLPPKTSLSFKSGHSRN